MKSITFDDILPVDVIEFVCSDKLAKYINAKSKDHAFRIKTGLLNMIALKGVTLLDLYGGRSYFHSIYNEDKKTTLSKKAKAVFDIFYEEHLKSSVDLKSLFDGLAVGVITSYGNSRQIRINSNADEISANRLASNLPDSLYNQMLIQMVGKSKDFVNYKIKAGQAYDFDYVGEYNRQIVPFIAKEAYDLESDACYYFTRLEAYFQFKSDDEIIVNEIEEQRLSKLEESVRNLGIAVELAKYNCDDQKNLPFFIVKYGTSLSFTGDLRKLV